MQTARTQLDPEAGLSSPHTEKTSLLPPLLPLQSLLPAPAVPLPQALGLGARLLPASSPPGGHPGEVGTPLSLSPVACWGMEGCFPGPLGLLTLTHSHPSPPCLSCHVLLGRLLHTPPVTTTGGLGPMQHPSLMVPTASLPLSSRPPPLPGPFCCLKLTLASASLWEGLQLSHWALSSPRSSEEQCLLSLVPTSHSLLHILS